MTRGDIECIIKWFSHIEQLATDGKTANGFQMPTDRLLATIKVVAKDSREYVEKFFNKSIPNDLEEAAWDCVLDSVDVNNPVLLPKYKELLTYLFIAGAKWQEERDQETIKLSEINPFLAGVNYQKGQMMKEAVEGEVCGRVYDHINVRFADGVCKFLEPKNISHIPADVSKYKVGDKVRIIIVKED